MTRQRFDPVALGAYLHDLREAAGMTQGAVARKLFFTAASVRCWEAGRRLPRLDTLDAYLRLVGGEITLGRALPGKDGPLNERSAA